MHSQPINARGESRFFPNSVALILQTIVATIITLLQVKILANFLAKEDFGLFASLRGFSLLIASLSAMGLPQLLVRFLPVHEAAKARGGARDLTLLCMTVALGVFWVLVFITHTFQSSLLSFVASQRLTTDLLFWFFATTLAVTLKLILYGALNGLRRLSIQLLLEVSTLIVVLLWILNQREFLTLELLFMILGIVNLGAVGIGFPLFFASLNKASTGGVPVDTATPSRVEYGSYLVWATGLSLVALAFTDVDRYLLSQVLALDMLALFHIAARVSRLGNRLLGVATLAFQPEVTRLHAEGRADGIAFATRVFLKFNTVIAVVMSVLIIGFSKEILIAVASKEYVSAAPLLVVLALCLPLSTMTAPITGVMKALNQVRQAVYADLVWAGTYVFLLFALGYPFGLMGIGAAQVLACVVQLIVAARMSDLHVDMAFVTALLIRFAVGGIGAFAPLFAAVAFMGDFPAPVVFGAKIIFFALGCFVYPRLLRAFKLFSADEKSALFGIFDRPGLGGAARFVISRI